MVEAALLSSFAEIPSQEWDALANPAPGRPKDPFLTHRFLLALESSGSIGAGTGWTSHPIVLRDAGKIVATMPLFAKGHSQGEYVFDHAWADAYHRAGGRYYPKLQAAVPFTPVTGNRLLGPRELRPTLWNTAIRLTKTNGLSSLHATFCTQDEAADLTGIDDTLHRIGQQYHWENPGYDSFETFLSDLSSRKRKAIRKERALAQGHGLTIIAVTGDQILPEHCQAMWDFYQDTGSRKWGEPYLKRPFFDALHQSLADDVLLILALDGKRPVAGALNFIGSGTLFGRYWGTLGDWPCLHFELCYYQAMDYAITHGLRVEAGAQGEHKIARGYLPKAVHSLHWIDDPGFRRAVANYLASETSAVDEAISESTAYGPFRKDL